MRKFETSQKDESRAQSADSAKAYRKPSRTFNNHSNCLLRCWCSQQTMWRN